MNPPAQVVFGDGVYPPGGAFGPRRQADHQLVLLYSGPVRIEVGGPARPLGAGQVALMRPGQRELYRFDPHRAAHHR